MKKNKKYSIVFLIGFMTFISCEEILFVEDISEAQVTILAPTENTSIEIGNITFTWQTVSEATEYELQVATPSFSSAAQIVVDSILATTSFSKELIAGNYQWRVRAINSDYQTAYTTNSFKVTDSNFTQTLVDLLLPLENTITNDADQHLIWNAVEGASEYRIQLWNPDTDGTKTADFTTVETSSTYSFPDGNYTWQVRAQNTTENSLYTARQILVDTTVPNTPTLESPADNSTTTVATINFSWTRADIIGSQETDSIYVYNDAALTLLNFKELSSTKTATKTLDTGTYYWVVKSFDEAKNQGNQSNTFTLNIN